MKNSIMIIAVFVSLVSYTSCKKDNSNGAGSIPQVSSMLRASSNSTVLNSISKDSLSWTAAKAQATLVKFEAKKSGSEIEFKSNAQQAIDLFANTPVAGNLNIPPGTYDEVELKTNLEALSGQPSLELKGSFSNNGIAIPVSFQSFESLEVKSEKNNVTIDPGSNYNLTTIIDLNLVLGGISASDLAKAERVNGEIRITSSVNGNLYKRITENLNNLEDECEVHRH
ncbi:MAG TPA: hypothetical protein VK166_14100 [Chitinophagaceae bacterium]|nr:hypothetical protein [Chitinophagaceae bacterium]